MPKRFLIAIIFLSFALPVSAGQFKVIRVYIGDTLKASGHDIDILVRLVGIDTPEKKNKRIIPASRSAKKLKISLPEWY